MGKKKEETLVIIAEGIIAKSAVSLCKLAGVNYLVVPKNTRWDRLASTVNSGKVALTADKVIGINLEGYSNNAICYKTVKDTISALELLAMELKVELNPFHQAIHLMDLHGMRMMTDYINCKFIDDEGLRDWMMKKLYKRIAGADISQCASAFYEAYYVNEGGDSYV